MDSCDLVIAGGTVLVSAAPSVVLENAAVAVRGAVVVDVGPVREVSTRWTAASVIDATGAVTSAGFVDAHVHLAASGGHGRRDDGVGVTAGPFAGGGRGNRITALIGGMVNRPARPDAIRAVAAVRLAAMLRCGYTGVVDAGGPGAEAVADAAELIGVRAAVGPSLADMWHDDAGGFGRRVDTAALLERAAAELDRLAARGSTTLHPMISAAGTQTSSDELLHGIAALAADRHLGVHVHSHVRAGAVEDHAACFGRNETERLATAGLLDERLMLLHAGALTDDDIATVAERRVTVNHNPVGNALLGFGSTGTDTVRRALRAGVRVAWGSDWSTAVTPPGELLRAAMMLHRDEAADDTALAADVALSAGVAAASFIVPDAVSVGRVAIGAPADLVVTDITGLHHLGHTHPVSALAWHARPDDVRVVVVDGRVRVRDGQLVDLDEQALTRAAHQALMSD